MTFTFAKATFVFIRARHRFVALLVTDIANYWLAPVPHTANKTLNTHNPGRCPFNNEINKSGASENLRMGDVTLATNALHQAKTQKRAIVASSSTS